MKKTRLYLLALIMLLPVLCSAQPYVFTSFREPSTQGMQYLYSRDGLRWDTIPGIWLEPKIGTEHCLRDPSIIKGPDGTFHLVWTSQWKNTRSFGYASSKDLVNWSEQREIPVMEGFETNNVWAPELFYDDELELYFIIWSSQIKQEEYTEADKLGTNNCHRMYYTTTKDFITFTPAKRYYDPGFNSIDGYLLKRAPKDYVLIVKDNRKPGFSNLFCVFGESPYGPFHTYDNVPIGTTPTVTFGRTFSEGPCVIKNGDEWMIFYDRYNPQDFTAASTKDFLSFTDAADRIVIPKEHKHGTIVEVTPTILDNLLKAACKKADCNKKKGCKKCKCKKTDCKK